MAQEYGGEIISGTENRFNDLAAAYRRMIELTAKLGHTPEMNTLSDKEQAELDNLKTFVGTKKADGASRYRDALTPDQHKQLQALEAQFHKLVEGSGTN